MAERTLKKKRGNIKITILRPTIITGAYEEPYRGWTDTVSASGGITYTVSTGVLRYIYGQGKYFLDLIPVDIIVNDIVVGTYASAVSEPKLQVIHGSSSFANPLPMRRYRNGILTHIKRNPYHKQQAEPWAIFVENFNVYKMIIYLT